MLLSLRLHFFIIILHYFQFSSEEHQLDSNPTERSLCIAKNNVENVTLVDGIGAGNFTDLGHVSDMSDCVSRCCSDSACELAFRIEDDCYGVTCYSEHSCRTRSARNAMSLKPMIAFVRDVGSRKGKSKSHSIEAVKINLNPYDLSQPHTYTQSELVKK